MSSGDPTWIYHFTDASNLPGILRSGNVYCKTRLPPECQQVDASHYDIQERRARKAVGCGPRGVLHDYVPLYFATQSPMMFAISKGGVEGCSSDTQRLVYLVSSVERVQELGLNFVFSDGHPTVAFTRFYDDVTRLDRVDWHVMNLQYWDDADAVDGSRRRQAEFLVHGSLPWSAVEFLVVKTLNMKERLDAYLATKWPEHIKPVRVAPSWYF
jgi:hypothetical protein